jgi:hypothetical protein
MENRSRMTEGGRKQRSDIGGQRRVRIEGERLRS